jgi:signal transduction histidine kinase
MPPNTTADDPTVERRHPLRFVWQMDGDGRFVVGSDEFIELVGPRTMAAFGRLWSEIAADLNLDPDHQVMRAIAQRETWSGIIIGWPVDETSERLSVELSGLPVFDRDRNFRGYRGFGVCRDVTRINQLIRARRERPIGFMPAPATPSEAGAIPAATAHGAVDGAVEPAASSPPMVGPTRIERPDAAPASANVVPFRSGPQAEPKPPALSPLERRAFRELAQELTARLRAAPDNPSVAEALQRAGKDAETAPEVDAAAARPREPAMPPVAPDASPNTGRPQQKAGAEGQAVSRSGGEDAQHESMSTMESALLDRIPIGVLVYRHDSLIYANRHFLDWSGYSSLDELAAAGGLSALFAEPAAAVHAERDGARPLSIMTRRGDKIPVDGRLFALSWNAESALALIVANGQVDERPGTALAPTAAQGEIDDRNSIIERNATVREKSDEERRSAGREAQRAAAAKAEFLTRVSHEIRTPLNAIAGFTEVIMAERFGPIGNERYRDYLKDIHAAGTHLVSLLNDLLDLSKIETGQLDLLFENVSVNDLTRQCVGLMQPQASRARIIIRTALTPKLPQVVADERSLRQIVLNLLANSIRSTSPGGQVIVSTVMSDSGEVVMRVRDTGVGMSEKDIEAVLEPFRQTATSGSWGSGGIGLGLPLTKALAEANHANFSIKSAPNAGILAEIAFPPLRVVAR